MTTFLQILVALPSLISTIIELMSLAEKAIPEAGTGASKKDYVLVAIQSVVNNNELWTSVKGLFSKLINMLALFNFNSTGKDPEPKSKEEG